MKDKAIMAIVALALLALASLACGGSGAASAAVDCPDGMTPIRLGTLYHGYVFEVAQGAECLGDSTFCVDFSGQIHAVNTVESSHGRCGTDMFGIPNATHAVCTHDGWVSMKWDGTSNYVCVKFHEE